MEAIEYWKLCDRVTIFQAAFLTIGRDPGTLTSRNVAGWDQPPDGYGAVKTALLVAVRTKLVDADIEQEIMTDEHGNHAGYLEGSVDLDASYIKVDSLIQFLRERKFPTTLFSSPEPSLPNYLDGFHEFYAPKLAAAVDAWLAITAERQFETKGTPKHWIAKWLRENAAAYKLNKPDGTLNEDAIQQIAKIVNWRPEGGAGKTSAPPNPSAPRKREK